ncbi:unnamed protein product [Rotaria magnacalcarata]|uniref:Uncharacterized protein n=5 Tax=Rotaria magnacalcarata TaxID=392030 RepID=A0A816WZ36_9BILA|nr:unnamed protein product [Rotaria magnacalcarata]CAF1624915.1 unnamed protein product [Rotaria magnacalcarata]CAF2056758.1 unnamed protein product [Rotaria magnacalcarata]CAF2140440.1 unnamed protein product [Rotaria magnacalcarata]CAF2164270.1 unnamed protein product [Rotaria magnacalcarata]
MDLNNGKPLSPWKAPSRISLKRIRHKINSNLSLQPFSSSIVEKNSQKQTGKRNRSVINKFALARSTSTPTADENFTPTITEKTNYDEHLLARLHQIMPPPVPNDSQFSAAFKSFSFEETFNSPESNKSSDEIVASFPIDWSLKSSCRFYSLNSSSFLNNFMKLRSIDESLALEYICSNISQDNEKALFRSLTSYWTYPHIAWLRLFPRTQQQQQTNANFSSLDEQAQIVLQDEWRIAFQSLFQAFRTKHSSFFYMCTHTFNILFREDSTSQIMAIISPTTSGLRSTLEREGIEFTMVDGGDLLNNSANKNIDEEDDENGDENDVTCAKWLEDMGLSTSSTNSNNERRCLSSNKKSSNGKTSATTIFIRDLSSVNSLFNFLLNKSQRTCMSLTGPLTGIPPTLISPRPFLNATLKYSNVHFQSNSMVTIDGGPLLPDRIRGLWDLFTEKHQHIQMICTNVERTSALNLDGEQGRTIKQISIHDKRDLRVQFATV